MIKKAITLAAFALITVGCGGGGGGGDEASAPQNGGADFSALYAIAPGESVQIDIPTYDGKNQVVHPDIIEHNGLFYLAITPYPWSNVDHENPSFYVSGDGLNFAPAGTNPIVDHPNGGYNDDPDVIIDPKSGEFRIYYNETPRDYKKQYLAVLKSPDGVAWTDHRKLVEFKTGAGEPFIVSPALIYSAGYYFMFHVEIDTKSMHSPRLCSKDPYPHFIRVMRSKDGMSWDKKQDDGIVIDYPSGFHPWHVDVVRGNGHFYMLINGYYGNFCDRHDLYLAVSDDLIHWHFIPNPVVTPKDAVRPNIRVIYRSSALVNGDDMFIYFSFFTSDNRWFLGLKHIKISDYVK
jgi:hypothetical protein